MNLLRYDCVAKEREEEENFEGLFMVRMWTVDCGGVFYTWECCNNFVWGRVEETIWLIRNITDGRKEKISVKGYRKRDLLSIRIVIWTQFEMKGGQRTGIVKKNWFFFFISLLFFFF